MRGVNINLKILPFGHVSIETKSLEDRIDIKEKKEFFYAEPKTIIPQLVEITFDGSNYGVPKSTGGIF